MPEVLNINEIRQRAYRFAADWRGVIRERAEAQSFWNDFFRVFGVNRRQVAVYEQDAVRASTGRRGRMDVFWPSNIAVEHKSAGEDLAEAEDQLRDYLPSVAPEILPRVTLVCDFHRFRGYDLEAGQDFAFTLDQLPDNIGHFLFLAGHGQRGSGEEQEAVNLQATQLMASLHDALKDSRYTSHPLRVLMVRLVFILFADDTGVWDRALFQYYLVHKTREDGSDLGERLNGIFQVLNMKVEDRSPYLDEDLQAFRYINGGLFEESIPVPVFTADMRRRLLDACRFDWSQISPAIFGSMFQEVMTDPERRRLGAHYTTEANILRTIRPLFLDDLESELNAADSLPALRRFRDKLAGLKFLDPACGCGNFLLIAYRELRRIELEALKRIRDREIAQHRRVAGQLGLDVTFESKVRVGQFYGIELEEFPARIAETAIYLVDHLANRELSSEFGNYYVRFPIEDAAYIHIGNALRMNWDDVLPADECSYVLGNPPFVGQYTKTAEQTADLELVWGTGYNGYLDYVTGWYVKTLKYVGRRRIPFAYVSTNSICQGEPVAPLWQPILDAGFSVTFAHRTFLWKSEARGAAGVHVVIIGLAQGDDGRPKRLFEYPIYGRGEPTELRVSHINPYLVEGPDIIVRPRRTALAADLPEVTYGNKPTDGGFLMVSPDDLYAFQEDPAAAKYIRPFIGARELIYGHKRWCLWLEDLDPADVKRSSLLRDRIDGVRDFRSRSAKAATRALAATPALFDERRQPTSNYLAIPAHVGEARSYFPLGYFSPDVITGNHNFLAVDPDRYLFGLLSSAIFITWMRTVSGRIRADLRFSKTLTWHNFPLPNVGPDKWLAVTTAAQAVLDAREDFPDRSLDNLYDPRAMPSTLVAAHRALDKVVDSCFAPRRKLDTEAKRQAVLFDRLQELLDEGLLVTPSLPRGRLRPRRSRTEV